MIYSVDTMSREVIYGAKGIEEVIQNVRTILTTRKGTVPLNRQFGIDFSFLDDPMPRAIAALQNEIFQAIKKYEPRAAVKEIQFKNDPLNGRLRPTIKVEVNLWI